MSTISPHTTDRQIAKNTLYLYVRMILIMCITLYTSRVVIDVLGIEDYGLYNLVGGLVVFFSFLNGSITGSTQRFLCVALGKNDLMETREVFSSSLIAYLILCTVIIILGETAGLWFVSTQLNFPPDKHNLAIHVYQISLLTAIINLLRMPYNAAIIAYERMSFFAWSSIIEVVLKLGILYPLFSISGDKLIVYAWLICIVTLIINIVYVVYVTRRFPECRFSPICGKLREILSFTGWSSFSAFANVGARQGMNFIVNIFCGVAVNAAVGIMNQVCNAVYGFIQNFQTAINPPLTKLFAAGDFCAVKKMLFRTSRLSYYLLVMLSMPLMFNINLVLSIWLKEVPPYTGMFCILCLLSLFFNTFGGPIWTIIQATGKIKFYQICISTTTLLSIPLFYLILWLGAPPYLVLAPTVTVNIIVVFIGVHILRPKLNLKTKEYVLNLILPCLATTLLLSGILYAINCFTTGSIPTILEFILRLVIDLVITVLVIALLGFKSSERDVALAIIKQTLGKK